MIAKKLVAVHPSKQLKLAVSFTKEHKKEEFVSEIETLEKSSAQEDFNLSVILAFAIKDTARVIKAFSHPARSATETALKCCAILSDDQLKEIIFSAVPATRKKLIKKIRKNHPKLMEAILPELSKKFNREVLSLLPFLPKEQDVTTTLSDLFISTSTQIKHLNTLKRRKPQVVVKLLENNYLKNKAKQERDPWNHNDVSHLTSLPPSNIHDFLKSIAALDKDYTISTDVLKSFWNYPKHAMEVVRSPFFVKNYFVHLLNVAKLSLDDLLEIFDLCLSVNATKAISLIQHVQQHSIKKWKEFVVKLTTKHDLMQIFNGVAYSGELPLEFGHKLAQFKLEEALKNKKLRDVDKSNFWTYFEISEVRKLFYELLANSDVTVRVQGYKSLIACSVLNGKDAWKETLAYLTTKCVKEADPVKMEVLSSINSLINSNHYLVEDMKALDTWFEPFFKAGDRSRGTMTQIVNIGCKAMHYYDKNEVTMKIGIKWIQAFVKSQKSFPSSIPYGNTPKMMDLMVTNFASLVLDEINKGNLVYFIGLNNFDPSGIYETYHNKIWESCVEAHFKYLLTNNSPIYDTSAIRRYLKDKSTRTQRIREILKVDNSAIANHVVFDHVLHFDHATLASFTRDQQIITLSILKNPNGRFIEKQAKFFFLPELVASCAHTLPLEIRQDLVEIYIQVLEDPDVDTITKVHAVTASACLQVGKPFSTFSKMLEMVKEEEDEKLHQVAFTCYRSLDMVDLDELFNMITKENAKSVVGAIKGVIRYSTVNAQEKVLGIIKEPKFFAKNITIQKEMIRLCRLFKSDETIESLSKIWSHNKTNKDILACIAATVVQLLPLESAWKIIEEFPNATELEVVRTIFNVNTTWSEQVLNRFVNIQFQLLNSKTEGIVKEAWSRISSNDEKTSILIAEFAEKKLINILEDKDAWELKDYIVTAFLKAIFGKPKVGFPILKRCLSSLVKLKDVDQKYNGNRDKDLPISRLLMSVCNGIISFVLPQGNDFINIFAEMAEIVASYDESLVGPSINFLRSLINTNKNSMEATELLMEQICKLIKDRSEFNLLELIDDHVMNTYGRQILRDAGLFQQYLDKYLESKETHHKYIILCILIRQPRDMTDKMVEFVVKCREDNEIKVRLAAKRIKITGGINSDVLPQGPGRESWGERGHRRRRGRGHFGFK